MKKQPRQESRVFPPRSSPLRIDSTHPGASHHPSKEGNYSPLERGARRAGCVMLKRSIDSQVAFSRMKPETKLIFRKKFRITLLENFKCEDILKPAITGQRPRTRRRTPGTSISPTAIRTTTIRRIRTTSVALRDMEIF